MKLWQRNKVKVIIIICYKIPIKYGNCKISYINNKTRRVLHQRFHNLAERWRVSCCLQWVQVGVIFFLLFTKSVGLYMFQTLKLICMKLSKNRFSKLNAGSTFLQFSVTWIGPQSNGIIIWRENNFFFNFADVSLMWATLVSCQ